MDSQSVKSQHGIDPLVSAIIPTYGRPERLRQLIKQLLDQDFDPLCYEVIVVDDGSPVSALSVIEEEKLQSPVRLQCLRQNNSGPAAARNHGASVATGKYLLFIDDDMIVPYDFVRGHLETQNEFGPGAVVSSFDWKLDMVPDAFNTWYKNKISSWGGCLPTNLTLLADKQVYEINDGLITAAALSIPKTDFDEVGGFDLGYSAAGCEDQDLGRRLHMAGVRAFLTSKTQAIHAESRSTLEQLCIRNQRGSADTVRLVRRFAHLYDEIPPIAIINGYIRFREDTLLLMAKKVAKQLITHKWVLPIATQTAHTIEKISPNSKLLPKAYDLIVGAHLQKGWREGLKAYGTVTPLVKSPELPEWEALLGY